MSEIKISSQWHINLTSALRNKWLYGFFFSAGPNWLSLTLQHFCCKPVPFFHTKWRKFPFLYTQEAIWWGGKKNLFFISKIYTPMSRKNGGQKQEWQYPTAFVGSYFIPDKNIQTYLICLQSCNMQKHQKANFRSAEYVCVQQWWLKVSIMHVSWPVTSWNTRSLPTCTRSAMWTGELGKTLLL